MNNQDQQNRQNKGGSGSAENTDRPREAGQHTASDLGGKEKKDIEKEIGSDAAPVASLRDLGALSGRDDASGGSGDNMENTSTGEPTEKF